MLPVCIWQPNEFQLYSSGFYYAARGWDVNTGAPTGEKLGELGLEYVAEQLAAK